jgi:hypothetical protein
LEALGCKQFPPKKAARLSRLLNLRKEDRLTPKQQQECDTLMAEADELEMNNLDRVVAQLRIEE